MCNVLLFIPSQKCLRIVAEVRVNIYHWVFAPAAAAVLSLGWLSGAVWAVALLIYAHFVIMFVILLQFPTPFTHLFILPLNLY